MATRDYIKHFVNPNEPSNTAIGDEWLDSDNNLLYKRLVLNGTTVTWTNNWGINITGNAATATRFANNVTLNGTVFDGTSNLILEPFVEQDESTNATRYIAFVDSTTSGYQRLKVDSGLGYNPNTNQLTVAVSGSATSVINTVTGTNSAELVRGNMADNDQFRILVGGTGSNAGFVEIATANEGTEPIFVRQYSDSFTTIARTLTLLDASGNTSVPGSLTVGIDLTVAGNLTVNGTTTTVNSSTMTVDDKNLELGFVASATVSTTGTVGSISGTGPWTATITGMSSTSGLVVGSAISATNGTGSLGAGGTYIVASIVSSTSITYTATGGTTPVAGSITNITTTGATNLTADGGGIVLKGTTDKTFTWSNANTAWTSSENINLAAGRELRLLGATSGTIALVATATAGTNTITFPAATGTVALTSSNLGAFAATTSAQLAGVISDETGSGALVFATSPSLTTPSLGVATATSINRITLTQPATGATLTIADGKTLSVSNTLTFTGTDSSSVAFGTGGTVAYTGGTLAQFSATTSAQLAGVISDETGSGALVFANTPTLVTPNIGAATGTSLTVRPAATQDGVTLAGRAGGTGSFAVTIQPTTLTASRTLTLADGNTTLQAGTMATTGGTLAQFAATTSAQLAGVISDETGSGALVFATSPSLTTPTLGVATATSINRVAITAPATGSTLTIADGKTLTANNTLTFGGTDGSSVAFGAGGTVVYTTTSFNLGTTSIALNRASAAQSLTGISIDGDAGTVGGQAETAFLRYRGNITETTLNDTTTDAARTSGFYRVSYPGASDALLDLGGIGGSTPRVQFRFNWGDSIWFRAARDTETTWDSVTSQGNLLLHSNNFNSYAPTLTGTGASGTWGINVTGNAATVTNGVYTNNAQTISGVKTFSGGIVVNDNVILQLGTGGEFDLFHDGANNFIDLALGDLFIRDVTTTRFTFARTTGNFTATGEVTAFSDRKLKDNIEVIADPLTKVLSLRGVTYTRTDLEDKDRKYVGVIAQEIEEILPEVVTTMADGTKTVAYGNIVGLLIEAIKEQQKQIDELRAKIK